MRESEQKTLGALGRGEIYRQLQRGVAMATASLSLLFFFFFLPAPGERGLIDCCRGNILLWSPAMPSATSQPACHFISGK